MRSSSLLLLAMLSSACNEKREPATDTLAGAAAAAPATPTAGAQTEKPVTIDKELVESYLAFERAHVAMLATEIREWKKAHNEATRTPGATNSLGSVAAAAALEKKIEAKRAELLAGSRLTEAEMNTVSALANEVKLSRAAWQAAGGDTTLSTVTAQIKEQMTKMSKEQQTEMQAKLDEMRKGMEGLRDATEARERFGDEAVELVLAHDAELAKLLGEELALLGQIH